MSVIAPVAVRFGKRSLSVVVDAVVRSFVRRIGMRARVCEGAKRRCQRWEIGGVEVDEQVGPLSQSDLGRRVPYLRSDVVMNGCCDAPMIIRGKWYVYMYLYLENGNRRCRNVGF